MNYTVAVVVNDRLFRMSFSEGNCIEVSSSPKADLIIPDFGHILVVTAMQGSINISDTVGKGPGKVISMKLNYPVVVDEARRIAVCISQEMKCMNNAFLGDSISVSLGRSPVGKNGQRNGIVLSSLPFVSRTQFLIVKENGRTVLTDCNSANGTFVNGQMVSSAELHRGDEISILTARIIYEEDYLQFENTAREPVIADELGMSIPEDQPGTELFERSPRIREQLPGGKIEIPTPPAEVSKPEINWLSTLLPAGVTVAIAVTMAVAFQNTMMMLYSLPMTIAGVVVSIVNYLRGNKKYKEGTDNRRTIYLKKLEEVSADINEKREAQKYAMLLADPSPTDCLATVKTRSIKLWCRKPDDPDFASVRVGTGNVPFSVMLDRPKEQIIEGDDLRKKPEEIYQANCTIEELPIICDIRGNGIVGLIGKPELTRNQLQNMILQLTTHHCCTELKLVCFYGEESREELSWLADLPHTQDDSGSGIYLACSQEEADNLYNSFTALFKQRKQEATDNSSYGSAPLFLPYFVFIFFEPKLLKKANPIIQYLFMEHGLGVGCLMAAQKIAELPKQCTEIITLTDNKGEMYNTASASERQIFCPDEVTAELRNVFSKSMRPLYCEEGIAFSTLPKSYSFYQMLGINSMSEFDIGKSWRKSDMLSSGTAPSAPIGILENGEKVFFNSPPTGDNGGAHALVAGTTGSGKSETLLSLIMSLALRYPPEEVGFLVIDFKGDSIAGKLTGLPHLRGVITNLDGAELRRSLVSIGAENEKRLKLFKEYNDGHPEEKKKISDIRDYMEKYHDGKVLEPLPHLFIVVDEFAQMKKQLPDVMDQFLSVAQIGRSLGVHIILATQSPSGVVDEKIRANIFKQLCLKVANSGESRDMIGSDLASRIKNPGQGYLKADDSLLMFQSAYGGGKLKFADGSESTQIREAVDAVAVYCRMNNIRTFPDIFCPPLPETVVFPNMPQRTSARTFGSLPVGLRDDPAVQFMGEYSLNVFSRNTLIIGSQLMGKTNLLLTFLRGAAEEYDPEKLNIYILEFSSLFLKNFETLPQIGGVVTPVETDKIANLFRMLKEQIDLRRRKFMERGVSTFSSYIESGARELPQILLIVDDLAAAKAYFPLDNDPLLAICKNGLTLGISVIATAAQPIGGMSYLPTFANRIAFYNNDVSVYNTLLGHTALRPGQIPGRCLVSWENSVYECQSYRAFEGQREIDRTEAIREFCRKQNEKANGKHAVPIPFIPKNLTDDMAFTAFPEAYHNGRLMIGMEYETVKPLSVKLAALGVFAVSGRGEEVKNFQRYMLASSGKSVGQQTEFYVVDGIERTLQEFSGMACVAEYSFLPDQAVRMILLMQQKAEERYAKVAAGDVEILDTSSTMVLMLNSTEAINAVQADKTALSAWNSLTGKLKNMNVCVVFGSLDNVSIPFGSDVLKKIKDDRKLVFLDDLGNLKIGDLPYSAVKKYPGTLEKGDGYFILGNEVSRIRVPEYTQSIVGSR